MNNKTSTTNNPNQENNRGKPTKISRLLSIEIKKQNIPEFIDFTKQAITLNAALVGGVFFKESTPANQSTFGIAAALFTFSIAVLFAFMLGLIEHKDAEILKSEEINKSTTEVAGAPKNHPFLIPSFIVAFLFMLAGLFCMCAAITM